MDIEELVPFIDHTILRPDTTMADIEDFISEAADYSFASLCLPPSYISLAAELLRGTGIRLTSVVGFPLGFQHSSVKVFEAEEVVRAGGHEIDMVINIGAFKSGEHRVVTDEIESVVKVYRGIIVKVIIETCLLSMDEKRAACHLIAESGAHFVKTSTGFSIGGATVEDVALLKEAATGRIQVKASGGIKDLDTAIAMVEAGASRIGTSAGVKIVEEQRARQKRR
ncbi:MAG: deoxyribose-phosphate aldolase [Deltaproteobacteria bacterium]|nr:deoxyribose-phosphate aldolase [Deltaproteobacteria bacterium]